MFAFYSDAALVNQFALLPAVQDTENTLPAVITQVFIGSVTSGKTLQAQSNPGVDSIVLSVESIASGESTSSVKLSTTLDGLATAVAGQPIELGVSIDGGVSNAISFFVSVDSQQVNPGTYDNLRLSTNPLIEV